VRPVLLLLSLLLPLTLVGGCGGGPATPAGGSGRADATAVPQDGVCRNLRRVDTSRPSNATRVVPCTDPHNAETYATGSLPRSFAHVDVDDPDLDVWAYQTCGTGLRRHLATTDSVAMRSMLTWVWFRPSERAWRDGARWYRCDVVGGGAGSGRFLDLPTTTTGLLARPDDHWMTCARGSDPDHGTKLPCTEAHAWRAVTTIKVGEPDDPYPGDAAVARKSKDFCASSVAAWLQYPTDYDYAYTWFGEREWAAGNRRSVCWARTDR
jgi:hypothetical protein